MHLNIVFIQANIHKKTKTNSDQNLQKYTVTITFHRKAIYISDVPVMIKQTTTGTMTAMNAPEKHMARF